MRDGFADDVSGRIDALEKQNAELKECEFRLPCSLSRAWSDFSFAAESTRAHTLLKTGGFGA